MTGVYVDTSALAKWYVNEAFSDEVEAFVRTRGPVDIAAPSLRDQRRRIPE